MSTRGWIAGHKLASIITAAVVSVGGAGAVAVVVNSSGRIAPPTSLRLFGPEITNGEATVSCDAPTKEAVTGYAVTLIPSYNDRVPQPGLSGPSGGVVTHIDSPYARDDTFEGLLEDCHQRYDIQVQSITSQGPSPPVTTPRFRPSGNVVPGEDPAYVVVLQIPTG